MSQLEALKNGIRHLEPWTCPQVMGRPKYGSDPSAATRPVWWNG